MDFLLPQPSPEGIARTRGLYRRKLGMEVTDAEAAEALSRVMRYVYFTMKATALCSGTDSMPESRTTIPR